MARCLQQVSKVEINIWLSTQEVRSETLLVEPAHEIWYLSHGRPAKAQAHLRSLA